MSAGGSARQVAAQLQAHIQAEGMRPGDHVGRADDLAARFGTSRGVLRAALRMLSTMHLVRISRGPGGGVFVADTFEGGIGRMVSRSVTDLLQTEAISAADLMQARIAIESPLAATAAASAGAELDAALASIVELADGDRPDHSVVEASGAAFHRAIADAAGNQLVRAITAWIFDVLQPELVRRQRDRVDEAVIIAQHDAIRTAIGDRDPAAAQQAMREHLSYLALSAGLLELPAAGPPPE